MNWYEYPAWGALGLIGCRLILAIFGFLLARLALRHDKPLIMNCLGGFKLGEAAVTQKPATQHPASECELAGIPCEFFHSDLQERAKQIIPEV